VGRKKRPKTESARLYQRTIAEIRDLAFKNDRTFASMADLLVRIARRHLRDLQDTAFDLDPEVNHEGVTNHEVKKRNNNSTKKS
jgi:hypothetical protein